MGKRRFAFAVSMGCLLIGLGGCQSTEKADDGSMAVKADNTVCPFTGNPVNESAGTVRYAGKNVGFCCSGCKGSFEKMSNADKDAQVAKINTGE